jgi:hypothetical protein
MSETDYFERVRYDQITEEYFIERKGCGKNIGVERKPLSQWGLYKRFELFVHVFRRLEQAEFEHQNKIINYKLPISFEITDSILGKDIFFKLERQAFDDEDIRALKGDWMRLMMRDLSNGVCQPSPMPNENFRQEDFPYLKITVGLAQEMTTKKEILELWHSKRCLGYYDSKLTNFII